MSKLMSQEELELHIAEASAAISTLMNMLAKSPNESNKKRSMLLGYWIKKYTSLIKREVHFMPRSLPRYKRGQILSVDFGFRVGKELGGQHFAVVLDSKNDLGSSVVTVVPLMSYKSTFKENRFTTLLPDGVYIALDSKLQKLIQQAHELLMSEDKPDISSTKKEMARPILSMAQNTLDELKHLKAGTVANSCQITTVSKMRITRPLNTSDAMYNVRLSSADMDKIYAQLRDLYIL